MLLAKSAAKKILTGAVGLGLVTLVAACETTTTTTTTSPTTAAESPVTSPTTAVSPTAPTTSASPATSNETIATVVANDDSFSTLRQAIAAAGLENTLNQPGNLTVFAPTNAAFEALPATTREQLLRPENREQLRQVLTYHVIPQRLTSSEITPGSVNTEEGQPLQIARNETGVTVNGNRVIQPDVIASNGVIHGIDQVLLPPGFSIQ